MNGFSKIFISVAIGVCVLGFASLVFSGGGIESPAAGTSLNSSLPETSPAITAPPATPEVDSDRDGLLDGLESSLGTDPMLVDTDGDGYSDRQEVETGHDPRSK